MTTSYRNLYWMGTPDNYQGFPYSSVNSFPPTSTSQFASLGMFASRIVHPMSLEVIMNKHFAFFAGVTAILVFASPVCAQRVNATRFDDSGADRKLAEVAVHAGRHEVGGSNLPSTAQFYLAGYVMEENNFVNDHRWTGLTIGAVVVGVSLGFVGYSFCNSSDSAHNCFGVTVGTAAMGAVAGGVVGGFLGRAFPKKRE